MVATPSIDNSEWVMQGVIRDPITGALLRVNADGSINVSGGGGTGTSAGTGFTSATTAGTAVVGTLGTNGLSLGVPAFITTGRASNDALGLNTAGTNITWTANSSGVSINAAGYAGTGTAATGASVTLNSGGISINLPAYLTTARASNDAIGLNTAQTNVTWTVNSSGLSLNASGYAGTATAITGNISITNNSAGLSVNASGLAGTATAMTNASATLNSAGLSLSIGIIATLSVFQNEYPSGSSAIAIPNGASISIVQPFTLQQPGSFSFIRLPVSFTTNSTTIATTGATLSASAQLGSTWNAVVYSLGTGASSGSLRSAASGSVGWTVLNSISVAVNGTQGSYTQQITGAVEGGSTSFSTQYSISDTNYPFSTGGPYTAFNGNRFLDINFANSLSAGAYWLVVGFSSSSATNSTGMQPATNNNVFYSAFLGQSGPNVGYKQMGSTNAAYLPIAAGSFSTNAIGTTASIPMTNISSIASQPTIIVQFIRSA